MCMYVVCMYVLPIVSNSFENFRSVCVYSSYVCLCAYIENQMLTSGNCSLHLLLSGWPSRENGHSGSNFFLLLLYPSIL